MRPFDARKLREALVTRKEAGDLTWTEISQLTGVAKCTLTRINTGGGCPNADNLAAIMFWLGVYDIREFMHATKGEL